MAKSKLIAALDAHKGRDHKLERQKKLQKEATKRKRSKISTSNTAEEKTGAHARTDEDQDEVLGEAANVLLNEQDIRAYNSTLSVKDIGIHNTDRVSEDAGNSSLEEADDESIPISDIESLDPDEQADILPHQRLTINNTSALQKAYKSIALPYIDIPFSAYQRITTTEPVAVPDVNDDLTRELALYKQCLDAANEGRAKLLDEGVPFSRPNDYFAEMAKNDEHMGKIKQKMTDEAANKRAAADARKQRDLKRFGKQVQIAKLQERDKAKRDTLEKINLLKRKRKNLDTGATNEEDLFDVALDDTVKDGRTSRSDRDARGLDDPRSKKRRKDEKFGFGGKKRFMKSTEAASTGDLRKFSAQKMKGTSKRLGKSRRAKL